MTSATEETADVPVHRRYVDGPFGQIHLRMTDPIGTQTPLICLHMSPYSGRIYERLLADLGRDRWAIALDNPGFGMSDAPGSPPEIHDYSAAVVAALDALEIAGPVDFIGYHTGSIIALDLARHHPTKVRRLALVAAPVFTQTEQEALLSDYAYVPPSVDGSHILSRWQGFLRHNIGTVDLEQVNDMFPEGLLGRGRSWWGHRAALTYDLDLGLPEVEQPVLVLNPGDDLQEFTRRAGPLLLAGSVVELPAWGHGFLDAHTRDVAELVRSFLDPHADPLSHLAIPASGTAQP